MGAIIFDALSDIALTIVDMIFARKAGVREGEKGASHDDEQ